MTKLTSKKSIEKKPIVKIRTTGRGSLSLICNVAINGENTKAKNTAMIKGMRTVLVTERTNAMAIMVRMNKQTVLIF